MLSLLTLSGCAKETIPVAVDLSAERCPEIPQSVREARAMDVPRPAIDAKTKDGRPALKPATHRQWIDKYDATIGEKDDALDEMTDMYEFCAKRPVKAS